MSSLCRLFSMRASQSKNRSISPRMVCEISRSSGLSMLSDDLVYLILKICLDLTLDLRLWIELDCVAEERQLGSGS